MGVNVRWEILKKRYWVLKVLIGIVREKSNVTCGRLVKMEDFMFD